VKAAADRDQKPEKQQLFLKYKICVKFGKTIAIFVQILYNERDKNHFFKER